MKVDEIIVSYTAERIRQMFRPVWGEPGEKELADLLAGMSDREVVDAYADACKGER